MVSLTRMDTPMMESEPPNNGMQPTAATPAVREAGFWVTTLIPFPTIGLISPPLPLIPELGPQENR
jgi:hypothetical protein